MNEQDKLAIERIQNRPEAQRQNAAFNFLLSQLTGYVNSYHVREIQFHAELFGKSDFDTIINTLLSTIDLYERKQYTCVIELPWTRKKLTVQELFDKTELWRFIQ